MVKNYTDFIKMNEAQDEFGGTKAAKGIGGLFKNLLGGLLKDVKDELKKPLEEFNKKLGNQKGFDDKIDVANKYFLQHRDILVNSFTEATTLPTILTTVEDNIRTAYASIGSTIKNLNTDNYTLEKLYGDSPERTKKLFSNDAKLFDKNVEQFSRDLILNLGKPYDITEEDLDGTPEEAQDQQQKGEIAQAQGETETPQEEAENPKDLTKLKEAITNWFDATIYKINKKKLEEVKKEGAKKPKEGGNIDAKLEAIPDDVTRNKDSVKNMANKLADLDKQTLMKVRDLMGMDKNDTPL